jgi:hypothetical protein
MPLVANIDTNGCGCTQFRIDESPFKTLTILVVSRFQMNNEPSSEPAPIKFL